MKKLLILIAVGFATVGGAAWAYTASAAEDPAWAEPADYSYRVTYMVFGPGMGTYDITVRNHSVTAVERLPNEIWPDDAGWVSVENAWTLADLEAKYFEAKANPESDATIEHDPVTGAPSAVSLDWIVDAVDDEEGFQILDYRPEG